MRAVDPNVLVRLVVRDDVRQAASAEAFIANIVREIKSAVASLGNVRYIPGMVDGSPATLRFYEEGVVVNDDDPREFDAGLHLDCE
jgi:hypothetical protein